MHYSDPSGTQQLLTTSDVLDYLRINVRTLYRLIGAGELPAIRIGRQWRIQRRDLDAWLDQHRAPAAK
jgi:excisionase family DNA binding protein